MVALIGAGCGSNAPSETPAPQPRRKTLTARDKAVKFAECMRAHGVSDFPDPDAKNDFEYGVSVSPAVWKQATTACKDLQPPGTLASKRTPKQQSASLKFAQCIRDNGVKDFPDPVNGEPLVDTYQIPSSNQPGGMTDSQRRDAEVRQRLGSGRRGPGVRRNALGAGRGGRPGRGDLRRGRDVGRGAPDRGRPGRRRQHREGGAGRALGDGLPGRDPDLPGAVGRLAVPRDQPGPRRLHQLPDSGDKVDCGDVLYRVDDKPVLLLCGTVPAYRALHVGEKGRDVRQLNRNLHQLGYDADADVRIDPGDNAFTSKTEQALRVLQRKKGVGVTGALALGDAVFLPEAVRIAKVTGQLGGSARPGAPVLSATSDTLEVQVDLDASQQGEVKKGDRAQITLPGNTSVTGRVAGFGRVAQAPAGQGRRPADATIPTFISLDDPAKAGGLDQAPVQVDITTKGVENALSVPVTALVGKSGGGFAVEVVRAGGRRELVAVKLGLFDTGGGRVQVEGDLRAGDPVVVPSL